MSKPKAPKPKIEYRIHCAAFGTDPWHRSHVYGKPADRTKAQTAADKTNDDLVTGRVAACPANQGCHPFTVEARVVAPWEIPDDAEELAEMLVRDWWDWGIGAGKVPPPPDRRSHDRRLHL